MTLQQIRQTARKMGLKNITRYKKEDLSEPFRNSKGTRPVSGEYTTAGKLAASGERNARSERPGIGSPNVQRGLLVGPKNPRQHGVDF